MTRCLAALALPLLLAGCVPKPQPGIDSPEPAMRLDAIRDAVARSDRSALPDLVTLLDSDDPATRLLAIRALENLTGDTLGYDYAAPASERRPAVERWVRRVHAPPPTAELPGPGR